MHLFSEDESTAELADRYGDWLVLQGLPDDAAADDLLIHGQITQAQREWLERFCEAFREAEDRETV